MTTTPPPWGTPGAAPQEPAERPAGAGFFLVVEQVTGSGESKLWQPEPAPIYAGATREAARVAALDFARRFTPQHPWSPQGRAIFRVDDDHLVVVVSGRSKAFHFRVTVAELVR